MLPRGPSHEHERLAYLDEIILRVLGCPGGGKPVAVFFVFVTCMSNVFLVFVTCVGKIGRDSFKFDRSEAGASKPRERAKTRKTQAYPPRHAPTAATCTYVTIVFFTTGTRPRRLPGTSIRDRPSSASLPGSCISGRTSPRR